MSRIFSSPNDSRKPDIDNDEVLSFFERRANRIGELGPLNAVMLQESHPDLAKQRNLAEKQLIMPLLALDGSQKILDIGCGTGRWAEAFRGLCNCYHGIDFSQGLITYANKSFEREGQTFKFSVASADAFSLELLKEIDPFDRILCAGVLPYLNDDQVIKAFNNISEVSSLSARIILRETLGIDNRLTIKDHYSDDLNAIYNSIYRTQDEIEQMMQKTLFAKGFHLIESGDVFKDETLNIRKESRQKWLVLER